MSRSNALDILAIGRAEVNPWSSSMSSGSCWPSNSSQSSSPSGRDLFGNLDPVFGFNGASGTEHNTALEVSSSGTSWTFDFCLNFETVPPLGLSSFQWINRGYSWLNRLTVFLDDTCCSRQTFLTLCLNIFSLSSVRSVSKSLQSSVPQFLCCLR